jgi:hypothetical protein
VTWFHGHMNRGVQDGGNSPRLAIAAALRLRE